MSYVQINTAKKQLELNLGTKWQLLQTHKPHLWLMFVWLKLFSFTFLWLLRTDGVTKAFSHRSHLYFLWPSCTTWMWTLSVSFLLKVLSHWSHLNVLSPAARTEEHWWEPFPVTYCCACKHTVFTHSKRGTNFHRGDCVGRKIKRAAFHCIRRAQTMVFRKVWFCSFLNRSSFYCASVAVISGETVNQTTLPYVSSERQMVLWKKKKKKHALF